MTALSPHPLPTEASEPSHPGIAVSAAPIGNRVRSVLLHIPYFSFEGPSRLAEDVGVSRSTICRLIRGSTNPSYRLVEKVTAAISERLGRPVDARDLFSTDGTYPITPSACDLCLCRGCLPSWAWDDGCDRLRPEWKDAVPGQWSVSPSGKAPEPSRSVTTSL